MPSLQDSLICSNQPGLGTGQQPGLDFMRVLCPLWVLLHDSSSLSDLPVITECPRVRIWAVNQSMCKTEGTIQMWRILCDPLNSLKETWQLVCHGVMAGYRDRGSWGHCDSPLWLPKTSWLGKQKRALGLRCLKLLGVATPEAGDRASCLTGWVPRACQPVVSKPCPKEHPWPGAWSWTRPACLSACTRSCLLCGSHGPKISCVGRISLR